MLHLENKIKNYSRVVLIACFVAFFLMVGMVNSPSSLFIVPVSETYGFSRAAFSFTISLYSLGSAVINIFYGKIYARMGIQNMVFIGFLVEGIAFIVMTIAESLPIFYLGGLLTSVGIGLSATTTMAILINSWFKKRQGTLIGFVSASSGLGGFLFSSLFAVLIAQHGYRSAYLFTAIVLLAAAVPLALVLKEKPLAPNEEKSSSSHGANIGGKNYFRNFGVLLKDRSVLFTLICAFFLGLVVHSAIVAAPAHMESGGIDEVTAGVIYGGIYFSMGVFKIIMGYIHDKLGISLAAIIGIGGFIISVIMLIFVKTPFLGWIYVVFAGAGAATESVLTPLLAHNVLGDDNYRKYLGIYSAALTCGIAVGVPIINGIYDLFSTYVPGFITYGCIGVAIMYMAMTSIHKEGPVR